MLRRAVDGVYIEDLGSLMGTRVNGRRISRYGPLEITDACIAGPCKLHISQVRSSSVQQVCNSIPNQKCPEQNEVEIVHLHNSTPQLNQSDDLHGAITTEHISTQSAQMSEIEEFESRYTEIRKSLHASLIHALDLRRHDVSALSDIALRQEAERCVSDLLCAYPEIDTVSKRERLISLVSAEAVGLGVLEPLLGDPDISEIMVNRYDLIFVERNGKIQQHGAAFSSEIALRSVIDRIVFPLGRRIDESSPMVDARLGDGSRINAVIEPVAIRGACLTIRKFSQKMLSINDLIRQESINQVIADLFQICIDLRLNMIVSGGTGSGKQRFSIC